MRESTQEKTGFTALIVEDDPIVCDFLQKIVESQGYTAIVCSTGASAVAAFVAGFPQLILLDWVLPDMDGLELSRIFCASERGKYLTILMISGKDSPEDIATAIAAGVNFFMAKPVEKKVLDLWLSAAFKHVRDCLAREEADLALAKIQEELVDNNLQLEEALSRANAMAMEAEQAYIEINQIFKTVAGGILLVDKHFNLLRCNDSFLRMAGVGREKAQNQNCYEIFHSCLCNTDECPLQRIRKGEKRIESEIEREGPDGKTFYYSIISTPFKGPGGDLLGIVEHITDVTERVKAEKALAESERRYKELSLVDELTRLFNKRYFNSHLQLEVERANRHNHPLSLLLLDIDNFKHHNDTYGHADGDRVLARLGRVIADSLRVNDVPCRYGGEEFTIILPETSGEEATVVAERIRSRFAGEIFQPNPGETVRKTVSIGVTQYRAGESEQALLERADQNMYEAKQGGKNRYVLK
ncbi:MAG: diguanylate cyclase [Desulfobulbaceae bacterium]|nr:diguanylate cyclase [Desulfobulbaceae bacterium]HIJ91107.1 diguanylate cyclase [Deltaproteobacteria bacterium]